MRWKNASVSLPEILRRKCMAPKQKVIIKIEDLHKAYSGEEVL
jgi:hypothetical protein